MCMSGVGLLFDTGSSRPSGKRVVLRCQWPDDLIFPVFSFCAFLGITCMPVRFTLAAFFGGWKCSNERCVLMGNGACDVCDDEAGSALSPSGDRGRLTRGF